MSSSTLPTLPANIESQNNEWSYRKSIIDACLSCNTKILIELYVKQVPNIKSYPNKKEKLSKFEKLEKLGLIGALNDSDVTSTNYKEFFISDEKNLNDKR